MNYVTIDINTDLFSITSDGRTLRVGGSGQFPLATLKEYCLADRCIGSIFEFLETGDKIRLEEGKFALDEDLDPIPLD